MYTHFRYTHGCVYSLVRCLARTGLWQFKKNHNRWFCWLNQVKLKVCIFSLLVRVEVVALKLRWLRSDASSRVMLPPEWCFLPSDASSRVKLPPEWRFLPSDASSRVMLPPEWCFLRSDASFRVTLPPEWGFLRSDASSGVMLPPEWRFLPSDASSGVMLPPERCFLPSDASSRATLPPEWSFLPSEASSRVMLPPEWCFLLRPCRSGRKTNICLFQSVKPKRHWAAWASVCAPVRGQMTQCWLCGHPQSVITYKNILLGVSITKCVCSTWQSTSHPAPQLGLGLPVCSVASHPHHRVCLYTGEWLQSNVEDIRKPSTQQ